MNPETLYAATLWTMQAFEGLPLSLDTLLSMLLGTGIGWLAVKERLRTHFWTRNEGEGLVNLMTQCRDRGDENRDRIQELEVSARHQSERIRESLVEPLGGIGTRLDSIAEEQAAQREAIKALGKSLDNLRGDGP